MVRLWKARAGGSGGGGGRGGGGGGSSSGGSSGGKGSSGGSSGGSSSGSGSSGSRGAPQVGGRPGYSSPYLVPSSQLSPAQRGRIWSGRTPAAGYGYGYYGYGRPFIGGPVLLFGFWPIYWITSSPNGSAPNNETRPGGDLIAAGVKAPSGDNSTYVVYGDSQTVQDVLPLLGDSCSAINTTAPTDLSSNTTLEWYREDSFVLYQFGVNSAAQNQSFVSCLNETIGNNLLVASASVTAVSVHSTCLLLVLLGTMLGVWV